MAMAALHRGSNLITFRDPWHPERLSCVPDFFSRGLTFFGGRFPTLLTAIENRMDEAVGLHFATRHVQITKDRFTLFECWMCQYMRCYHFCCSEPGFSTVDTIKSSKRG